MEFIKLHILSDLHSDHRQGRFELEEAEHRVLICVGDVWGSVIGGIEVLGKMNKRPVVFVGGTHEFYGFKAHSWKRPMMQVGNKQGRAVLSIR